MLPPLSLLFSTVSMIARTANCDTSLSPATWPPGEFERLEKMTLNRFEQPKPLAVSAGKGLVAGTTEPLAVHAGLDALRKGGNAMDACLATALTGMKRSVMEEQSLCRTRRSYGVRLVEYRGGRAKENFCVRATRECFVLVS